MLSRRHRPRGTCLLLDRRADKVVGDGQHVAEVGRLQHLLEVCKHDFDELGRHLRAELHEERPRSVDASHHVRGLGEEQAAEGALVRKARQEAGGIRHVIRLRVPDKQDARRGLELAEKLKDAVDGLVPSGNVACAADLARGDRVGGLALELV
eukprot:15445835-Alexandrium_andersonii.AAC.1